MTQSMLDHAVARATGETLVTVRSVGFLLDETETGENEPQYLWLDCPFCGKPILLTNAGAQELPEEAECAHCDTVFDNRRDRDYVYEATLDEIVDVMAAIESQCAAA